MAQHDYEPVPWPAKRPPATRLDQIYLTVPEVARLLKLHPNTIYRWAADGGIPSVHLGGSKVVRVPRKALWDWLEAQKKAGATIQLQRTGKKKTA